LPPTVALERSFANASARLAINVALLIQWLMAPSHEIRNFDQCKMMDGTN